MAEPHIVSTLRRKVAELQDAIAYYEGKAEEARTDLAHVSATLRLYEVDGKTLQFPAHASISRLFKRGELVSLARKALAVSGQSMTTRELAAFVVAERGYDTADKRLASAIAYRLVQALNLAHKRGTVGSAGKRGNVRVWRV